MKIILKQSVINKVLKKHNISVNTLRDLPEKLHNPVLVFKSARKDTDAVVVMIDAIDNDGNNIVVAIDLKGRFNQLEVNDITSIYGKDSYEGYANWAENIITGDEKKVKAWIQSLPENDRRGVSKSMLSRLQEKLHEVLVAGKDSIKNPSMQENGGNNSQQEENGGGRVSFMVSEERDADYMDAVKKGDEKKARRMVREAAKRAMPETKVVDENGEPRVMYHGTNLTRVNGSMPFWVFNEDSHFGTREQAEDAFGRSLRRKELSKIYSVYLDIRNPKRVDDVPEDWLKPHSEYWEPIIRQAKEEGYDGLVYSNTWEASEQGKDSYVAFYPEQVKSADPVMRDDRGNVIPLSERFNPEKEDIRFMSSGESLDEAVRRADRKQRLHRLTDRRKPETTGRDT